MKDYIREIIDPSISPESNKMLIREYIQEYVLKILYTRKIYSKIVFCGGTALRFLYNLKRFSEDLDFSLKQGEKVPDFETLLGTLENEFSAAGYSVEITYSIKTNVYNAFFKFPGLLYEFNLSNHEHEKLSIKIELDINPPAGGREEITTLNRTFMFYIQHFDKASLFAGKIHAAVCRQFTKGRDWYDLIWYRTKFPDLTPNIEMLNNALKQTNPDINEVNENTWQGIIRQAVSEMDIEQAKKDISRFLEIPEEADLISKSNVMDLFST